MSTSERPVTGEECKLYYNETEAGSGAHAGPSWTEITGASNVSFSLSKSEADQGSRRSKFKKDKGTQKAIEITFSYRKKQGTDAVFDALIAAAFADTVYEYAVMDGDIDTSGMQGLRAFCEIFTADGTQDLESAEEVEFTLKPTYEEDGTGSEIDPEWYEVS